MSVAIWGTKVGMTRIFDGDVELPVTVVEIQPNEVVEIKTADKHGYEALKVACGQPKKKVTKSLRGEFQKADVAPRRFLREIPAVAEAELGSKVTVELLNPERTCDISGTSKGRGFTGTVKRHNFSMRPATHGHKGPRLPGSIGCRMDPGKVFKGKKMAGQHGNQRVTVRNLAIVKIDAEKNIVLIKGAVPGPNGGLVHIRQQ